MTDCRFLALWFVVGSEKSRWGVNSGVSCSFGAGVLGDGLGALGHGVLGQLSGQQEAHGGLDLPGGDGGALVVVSQAGSLGGDALKDVVDERVHDAHGLGGDAGVGVDLLQHLVHRDQSSLWLWAALKRAFGLWGSEKGLASETVQSAALPLERVHHVHGGHGLPLGVLGVGDGVPNDVLQEDLEHPAGLLVDEAGDTLDSATAGQAADGGFGDALDVITENFATSLEQKQTLEN
ncbi:unnamed protein product [Menidia menidia]|uniref:(Atlantic silverside) hypothetical protein n=1 Tax=Menidia menidia TaxID=238744 RepID=A0A8S4AV40_9TELE|nr:unnamed protein product [Menidia menidia]